jgi:O-antigen ligase
MEKLSKFLKKFDDNLMKILVAIFIFLVPLWPKLPFRTIDYTYIAIRFEDFYVALITIVFVIQLLRKKVKLNRQFIWLFGLFWLAVGTSTAWGIYVSKTIEFPHLGILHFLRRIEYMFPFFIAASVIKTKKDFFQMLGFYFFSVFLVVFYGMGQKFLNFPAVQTMNPEYAKGYILYLTPEARISGTFAGHYDLASYLVFAIPMLLGYYFYSKKKSFLWLFIGALAVLIYTSSRISFGAYVVATLAFLIWIRKYLFTVFVVILTVALVLVTGELTDRFLKTLQVRRILVDENTGAVYVGQTITSKELPAGSFYVPIKDQSKGGAPPVDIDALRARVVKEKIQEASAAGQVLTDAQKADIAASASANLKPVNTVVSDISFATRLQVEWPRAIEAFKKNIILGTGPSSITEATDNDYLRWLGEIGLFGTLSFLGLLGMIVLKLWRKDLIVWGFIFGLGALMINASYIDVFEASKVAYTFWTIAGLFIGYYSLKKEELK